MISVPIRMNAPQKAGALDGNTVHNVLGERNFSQHSEKR
jgi:hypothetical protein